MKCVRVNLKEAEKVKKKLTDLEVFDDNYLVEKDEQYIYFPINGIVNDYEIVDKNLDRKRNHLSFEDLLKNKLEDEEIELISKSFDVIGDIAILEVDDKLLDKKEFIVEALLKSNKNIKTVIRKKGIHEGVCRLQDYEFLGGVENYEALYKESGILVKLDVRKTYFSPRLSTERLRISRQITPDENVLVMFSGVAVYGLIIIKHSKANLVYCVEINEDASKYAEENVNLNKFSNKIRLFCGDVNEVVPKIGKKFDRILMPLPKTSIDFLDLALSHIKKGGIIHFYCFADEQEVVKIVSSIKERCKCEILGIFKCGQASPRIFRYCIDFRVL